MSQEIEKSEQEIVDNVNKAKQVKNIVRPAYEEAIVNMMSNAKMVNVSFYSFILAKCKVVFDPSVPTAGVNFTGTSYNLFLGEQFAKWTLEERIAVLVHESRHILGGHMFRKGERDHQLFNIAADIAMNQLIDNLPEGVMFPETFDFPKALTAEQYYELLREEQKQQEKDKEQCKQDNPDENDGQNDDGDQEEDCDSCGGSGEQDDGNGGEEECEDCKGSGKQPGNGQPNENSVYDENGKPWTPKDGKPDLTRGNKTEGTIDDHSKWEQCEEGSEDLAKSITEKMVKDAVSQSRGNLPGDIEQILEIWKRKAVISWKKELKQILSSKSGKKISTIKRRDRRFPHRADLRGKKTTKDKHEIVVGIDTSGSMDDSDILNGLVEILEVAKVNGSELKLIQIDTDIKSIEIFSEKNKVFKRRGYGGTYMGAIVPFIEEQKLKPDVLIMISDMYIEDIDTDENWNRWKTKTLWLNTSGGGNGVTSSKRQHKIINFTDK